MDYFIPAHVKGYFAKDEQRAAAEAAGRDPDRAGLPYEFFRGIHAIPDALADSHHANNLGIVPVEEMTDEDWHRLGLDKDAWMAANRPQPEVSEPEMTENAEMVPDASDHPAIAEEALLTP